jgi:hypothetical protein
VDLGAADHGEPLPRAVLLYVAFHQELRHRAVAVLGVDSGRPAPAAARGA